MGAAGIHLQPGAAVVRPLPHVPSKAATESKRQPTSKARSRNRRAERGMKRSGLMLELPELPVVYDWEVLRKYRTFVDW